MVNIQKVVMIIIIINTVMIGFIALEPKGEVLRVQCVIFFMELHGGVFLRPGQEYHVFHE